jgi:hypothetical protein
MDHSAFIFSILLRLLDPEKSFETPGNIQPTTRRHIPEDL